MPAKKKTTGRKRGPKPFAPSKSQIMRYQRLKAMGESDERIALLLGIPIATFRRHKAKFDRASLGKGKRGARRSTQKASSGPDSPPAPRIGLTPKIRRQLILLAENGLTNEKAADIAGISEQTLYNWFKIDPTLKHDMKVAKERAVQDAINALRSRVLGFDTTSVSETTEVDKDGKERVTHRQKTRHRILPSVPAAKLYLSNMAQWVTDAKNLIGGSSDDDETEYDIRERLYDEAESNTQGKDG